MRRKIVVAGASGLVGYAAAKHFAAMPGCSVLALSRRPPLESSAARFVAVDLIDVEQCAALPSELGGVTDLVYAALYERPQLIAGWRDERQIETNALMFRNLLDAVLAHTHELHHVTVLQGTKAYGVHVRPIPIPAREDRDEAHDVANFYWAQEDYLKACGAGAAWGWTVFRPQVIFGESIGSAMNLIPAIGAYGALLAEAGEPLHYPGGNPNLTEGVDADLLAHAIAWAHESAAADNQAFNITNGDVFRWQGVWPAIADALGMEAGVARPLRLAEAMPGRKEQWDEIRNRYGLVSPGLDAFVGLSFQYADSVLGFGDERRADAALVSTVKLRRAGFGEMIDTEEMLRKWFRLFQEKRLVPPRRRRSA